MRKIPRTEDEKRLLQARENAVMWRVPREVDKRSHRRIEALLGKSLTNDVLDFTFAGLGK